MDRVPLPPPFPVGTKLRYVGKRTSGYNAKDGSTVYWEKPGLEVVITDTRKGRQGTLSELYDFNAHEYIEDEHGDRMLDETVDGMSVYEVTVDGRKFGRLIRHENAHEWEPVK